jgi:hypothetical protein
VNSLVRKKNIIKPFFMKTHKTSNKAKATLSDTSEDEVGESHTMHFSKRSNLNIVFFF